MVEVKFLRAHKGAILPEKATEGSAGFDLFSVESATIMPGERRLVPTGWCVELPLGYEAQIRSRSGLALKYGLVVLNAPGTIDSDYRGEVGVLLVNYSTYPVDFDVGARIAQMVISPVIEVELTEVAELDDTDRGDGGFGSTGS